MSEFTFSQLDTAASGNGGGASASASGGAMATGDINSGGNMGSAIGVGDTMGSWVCDEWGKCYDVPGSVMVSGGSMGNSTNLGMGASGGTAISDASGGSYNIAFVS